MLLIALLVVLLLVGFYFYRFYPQQQMPVGDELRIKTPQYDKYRDDCLHPCVRERIDGEYVMVQSPYYAWNNKVENPMYYHTNNLKEWVSVSKDWKHFKTIKKPLVNNHCSENYTGYRQYYYKPTAVVKDDSLYLYYTANAKDDPSRNQLFLTVKPMCELKF